MTPWPRRLSNYPIILIAIVQQYIAAIALLWQHDSHFATSMHILYLLVPDVPVLAAMLFVSATLAIVAFQMTFKICTLLMLLPQQLTLFLSAGAAAHSIWLGQFADGVQRSNAFLLTDQCPVVLLAFFHTWAMVLILMYAKDSH